MTRNPEIIQDKPFKNSQMLVQTAYERNFFFDIETCFSLSRRIHKIICSNLCDLWPTNIFLEYTGKSDQQQSGKIEMQVSYRNTWFENTYLRASS